MITFELVEIILCRHNMKWSETEWKCLRFVRAKCSHTWCFSVRVHTCVCVCVSFSALHTSHVNWIEEQFRLRSTGIYGAIDKYNIWIWAQKHKHTRISHKKQSQKRKIKFYINLSTFITWCWIGMVLPKRLILALSVSLFSVSYHYRICWVAKDPCETGRWCWCDRTEEWCKNFYLKSFYEHLIYV